MSLKTLFISAFLILGLLAPALAEKDQMPHFKLTDIEQATHSWEEFKGKIVVMDFWATWCVTCRNVFPHLSELAGKYSSDQVKVVGINTDKKFNKSKLEKFMKSYEIDYQILFDQENKMAKILDLTAVPSLVVFDEKGKIIAKMNGYDEDQEKKIFELVYSLLKK